MSEAVKLDSQTQPARAVVVLGMHRSGTSAVTRLINLMGAELGDRLMVATERNNEAGFWEHQDIVDLHDEVLATIGRRWDDVREFPVDLDRRGDLATLRDDLLAIIRRDFAHAPLWAVKDPRLCRLVPFWRPALQAAGAEPAYVIVLRNPLEVARSLQRRDGFAFGKGLLLWLRHVLEAERDTRGAARSIVRYEDVISDWADASKRLGATLNIVWPRQEEDVRGEVADFLKPSLRHFSVDDADWLSDPAATRWVREVYSAMLAATGQDDDSVHRRLDSIANELAAAGPLYDPVVDSQHPLVAELYRRIRGLELMVSERDTRVIERDTRIAERDAMIAERDSRVAERDGRISILVASVTELRRDVSRHAESLIDRNYHIKNLEGAIDDAREERDEFRRSTSWRMTAPFRAAITVARSGVSGLRRALALFRYKISRASLTCLKGVQPTKIGYRLDETTGYFRLDLPRVLPAGKAIVSFRLNSDAQVQLWLYQGGLPEFDIGQAVRLPFAQGEVRAAVELPAGISALHVESGSPNAEFSLDRLNIVELGNISLALFRLKTFIAAAISGERGRAEVSRKLRDGLRRRPRRLVQRLTSTPTSWPYQEWIDAYDTLTAKDLAAMSERISSMRDPPLISVVMPCYQTPERWLRRAIESVIGQIYPHWELCIADDASSAPYMRSVLEEYARRDPRIKLVFRGENGHIARATNSALELATGQFIALLDHDDEYRPHALYMVAEELQAHPDLDVVYSDEDKIDTDGKRFDPYFKTDYNPDLLLSHNYLAHLIVYRRELIERVGAFRSGFEGSQDYDLALRCLDATLAERVRHIPFILYHWRAIPGSVALSSDQKSYAHDAARRAIGEHLARIGVQGAEVGATENETMHRVIYPLPAKPPKVSLIVPTRDRADLLAVCVTGILEKTDYPDWEMIIVDNGSIEPETRAFFKALGGDPRIRVVPYPRPFNYSAINNLGASKATGSILCLLNNDIEPIGSGWLKEMVSHALRPGVGAVGAKLYYANDTIQHAGVVTGIGGVAGHFEKHLPRREFGYFCRPGLIQNLSAVTGACLVIRREIFEQVGGLDEKNLTVAFNDIDFCLRVAHSGYRNVYTPFAELYHYESASRGYEDTPEKVARFGTEATFMKRRWGVRLLNDPYFNPNLSLHSEQAWIAFPPRATKPWKIAAPAER